MHTHIYFDFCLMPPFIFNELEELDSSSTLSSLEFDHVAMLLEYAFVNML